MGLHIAYIGSLYRRSTKPDGLYFEDLPEEERLYVRSPGVPSAQQAFDTLVSLLQGTTTLDGPVRATTPAYTLCRFDTRRCPVQFESYVTSSETWETVKALNPPGLFSSPAAREEYRSWTWEESCYRWANGGDYSKVLVIFEEVSFASNLLAWGEHRTQIEAAVRAAVERTNSKLRSV